MAAGRAPVRIVRKQDEHALQRDVACFLRLTIGPPGCARADGVMWWGVDHAAASSAITGALRRARGVCAGQPDIMILVRGRLCGVELKSATGRPSAAQSAFADALRKSGAHWAVCRSVDDVRGVLEDAGRAGRGMRDADAG
ncbi:MAG: VRR-NUC domain-containing protein [Burkholderiaceae bacterium]|nr:VRR-NUC domain-containing protein [Burkholderiaceae bacterium]